MWRRTTRPQTAVHGPRSGQQLLDTRLVRTTSETSFYCRLINRRPPVDRGPWTGSRDPVQRLLPDRIDKFSLVLLSLLPKTLDLVIPFCLGVGFADEGEGWIAFKTFREFHKDFQVLSNEFLAESLKRPPEPPGGREG